MNIFHNSADFITDKYSEKNIVQQLLFCIFNNLDKELLKLIKDKNPLCLHTWITAQHLISIASLRDYHKSYICLLNYFHNFNLLNDSHSNYCSCMKIDLNHFNKFGITPFLKSLPCSYELLKLQIQMGVNLKLSPRCSLFLIINPLYAYMKHLVNQVYDQMIDDIDVALCLEFLLRFGLDPNYVPPNICSNLMVLFSIAADISVQSESRNRDTKTAFLDYLDRILEILLNGGLDPTLTNHNNKLSYEIHGDGLFDFIFMLKYPTDDVSIKYICHWIMRLIQHGCDPQLEMRSKCRDLLKFKLVTTKPNIALSVFFYVIHELFDDDFVDSPHIRRIRDVLCTLTGQCLLNSTISYFRKTYSDSTMFGANSLDRMPQTLKHLARYSLVRGVLHHRILTIDRFDIPSNLIAFVRDLQ